MSVIERRVGEVLCWWLAGANPLVRQPAVHEVRGCPQQCLSTAAPFSLCPCSSMGPLWATVPSEVHLAFHELINGPEALQRSTCSATEHLPVLWPYYSLSSSLLLSIPLFFLCFPLLRIFCLFLICFSRGATSLADGLSCMGSLAKTAGNGCVWHRAVPGLLPQRPFLQPLCCQTLAICIQFSL